ncbi:hypothetical protein IJJ53_02010 [Candidatus Saccharibacteria bacterium]|nr:hypothetical protein [Candidatus Saccharibacteria bacterium]
MGKSNKTNKYTEFYYHFFRNTLIVSLPILVISALILGLTVSHSSATSSGTDSFTVSISSACTLSSIVDSEHNIETNVGTYVADVGKTTIKTLCNDGNGYSVYAVGYSNNEEGNNRLINTDPSYSNHSIETGLNTSGLTSAWAVKLNNIPDDPSPTPPTIESDYNNVYGIVPPYWTKVAGRASGTTDMAQGSSFTTTYAVYASSSQYAGTYQGQVKYLLTHPSTQVVAYYMQDVANWQNEIPNPGDTLLATDARDNKEYWVTRLADGHIWMTQNLDFDIKANTVLNSNTTDLNVAYDSDTGNYREYLDGYTKDNGIIYYAPASTATTIDFTGTTVPGWQNSNTTPYTANKTDSTETGHASLGNYYNWTAAIASNNSSSLTQDTLNDISKNPKNSICPKGWRLPTISSESETIAGSTNEFARLNLLYNNGLTNTDAGLTSQPLYFIRSGWVGNNKLNETFYGFYRSSTAGTGDGAHYLLFGTSRVVTNQTATGNSIGLPVRCIAK